jgi:hypothetical protein
LFSWLPAPQLRRWLAIGVLITALFGLYVNYLNVKLLTAAAPLGIVSLQFAPNATEARKILESWEPAPPVYPSQISEASAALRSWRHDTMSLALRSVVWDFGFLISYGITLSLLSVWAGGGFPAGSKLAAAAGAFAWAAWLGAFCDALVNFYTLLVIFSEGTGSYPGLLRYLALAKILLAFGVLAYCAWGARKRGSRLLGVTLAALAIFAIYPAIRCFRG